MSKTVPSPELIATDKHEKFSNEGGEAGVLEDLHIATKSKKKEPTAEQRRASLHVVALQAKGLIASKDAADLHELLGVKLPEAKATDANSPRTKRDQRRRKVTRVFTTHIMRKTQSGTDILIRDSRLSADPPPDSIVE